MNKSINIISTNPDYVEQFMTYGQNNPMGAVAVLIVSLMVIVGIQHLIWG